MHTTDSLRDFSIAGIDRGDWLISQRTRMESLNQPWLTRTCLLLTTNKWPSDLPLSFDGSWFEKEDEANEACRKFCQAMASWGKVRKVTIKHVCLNEQAKESLEVALASNAGLQKLTLHGISSQDGKVEFLSRSLFSSNKRIDELTLDKCLLRNQDGHLLQRILNENSIKTLRLIRENVDEIIDKIASRLSLSSSLQTLDLTGSQISSKSFAILMRCLSENTQLKSLILKDCGLGDKRVEDLNHFLLTNRHLKSLDLCGNDIGTTGIDLLAKEGLRQNTSLQKLQLSQNPLGDDGAMHLTKVLQTNSSLQSISLIDCEIWGPGCQHLAEGLIHMKGLKHLFVDGEMQDYASLVLASLQHNMTLTHVWTDRCGYLVKSDHQWRLVEFFLRLNRGKRRLLIEPNAPASLWPLALQSISGDPRLVYYMLRHKPEIMLR